MEALIDQLIAEVANSRADKAFQTRKNILAAIPRWVDVSDRLPALEVDRLCCDEMGDYFTAHIMSFDDDGFPKWTCPYIVFKWLDGPLATN